MFMSINKFESLLESTLKESQAGDNPEVSCKETAKKLMHEGKLEHNVELIPTESKK